jgi:hypothetical protein
MQEARKIDGIQNYPFIFIKNAGGYPSVHWDGKNVKDVFDENGDVIPISTTCVYPVLQKDIIVTVKQEPDGTYFPMGGSFGNIATREDEYVVLYYTYTRGEYSTNVNSYDMGFSLITNYGNIISGGLWSTCMGCPKSEIRRVTTSGLNVIISATGYMQKYGWSDCDCPDKYITFIPAALPPKECYVPQVFVDVISIFLKHTQLESDDRRGSNTFRKTNRELIQKFKEICYKFTHDGYNDKSKDEEIERLKSLLQERDKEIHALNDCNKMVYNLNRVVDENADEIDQLQQALTESRRNTQDLRDRLSYRLAENIKMGKKKAECTRIVGTYKREVEELENEIANLRSTLNVYNIV